MLGRVLLSAPIACLAVVSREGQAKRIKLFK